MWHLHDFEAWLLPYWEKIKRSQEATARPLGRSRRRSITVTRLPVVWQRFTELVPKPGLHKEQRGRSASDP